MRQMCHWPLRVYGIAVKLSERMFMIDISELVQLKLNIETSVGDSTPTEAEKWKLHLIEGGVLELG